jgi:nitroreductase
MNHTIESNIHELPNGLLRTKINWMAHDLDKTINAYLKTSNFIVIANKESKLLKLGLSEWKIRNLEDDELISWARKVLAEFEALEKEENERNSVLFDYNDLDPDLVWETIRTRRSIRRWKNKAVPREFVKKVVEAGQWAPSACNRQSCRFLIIEGGESKTALVKLREAWLKFAPIIIFIGADRRNYLENETNYVPYMDASMATQNMLLMAHSLGLGAVVVKTTGWEIKEGRSEKFIGMIENMMKTLAVPDYFIPVNIMAMGFPDRTPLEPARMPFELVANYNKFTSTESNDSFNRDENLEEELLDKKNKQPGKFWDLLFRATRKLYSYLGIRIARID